MAGIDWAKVASDYARSDFDRSRLETYARKVAEQLVAHGAAFDGYTDGDAKSFWAEAGHEGFFKTLLKDRTGIDYQHIGYWGLAAGYVNSHHQDRKKTRFKDPFGKGTSFSVQMKYGGSSSFRWVKLPLVGRARSRRPSRRRGCAF